MSGVSLEIEAQGLDIAQHAMQQLIDAGNDLSPVMDDFGAYLASITTERFDSETAPDGTPWQQSERALEEGGKTLTDHGHLRDSFTWNLLDGGQALEFGSTSKYAGIHQFGGETGRNHATTLPAREMITADFNDDDGAEMESIIALHFDIAI